jgi:carboxyl-terminal processing protease
MPFYLWLIALMAPLLLSAADRLEPTIAQREKIARESRQALAYLAEYHYSQKPINQISADQLIREFVSELDYSRMFFTEKEIQEFIEKYQSTLIGIYLSRGDLYPAIDIYNRYYTVAQKRHAWIRKRLKGDFDFNTKERYAPERDKSPWPENNKEADTLWSQRLTQELLVELLAGRSLPQAKEKLLKRYDRSASLLDEFDLTDLQTLFLSTIGQTYDPHSNYFSNDDLDDFSVSMSNKLVGIGAQLRDEDGYCVIQELIPGGPAERSHQLHPGDKIIEVAQEGQAPVDVVNWKINKIVTLIRGEAGSQVTLTIIPAGSTDDATRKTVALERQEIRLTENLASAQVIEVPIGENQTIAVGVIELPSFYGSGEAGTSTTSQDIHELIEKLSGMGIRALVLDLRRNGGGLLSEAINLTGLFVPRAPVVLVRDSNGRVRVDWDKDPAVAYEGPLVVLTSRLSASASEIVAGALQSLDRAIVVGDSSTHGKGTVQAIFEVGRGILPLLLNKSGNSGGMKITIQKFYLPNGASTQHKGVPSDIPLPSINDYLPIGESDRPTALPWDTIPAGRWQRSQAWQTLSLTTTAKRDYLIERSRERQTRLPEFSYLSEIVARLKAKQEQKALWLNYDLRKKEKELDEAFLVQSEKKREQLSSERYASADVLLDISWKMKAEHQQQLRNSPLPDGSSRLNAIYENIFYYAPEGSLDITEVNAEKIDFTALAAYTPAFAQKLGLTTAQVEKLWEIFKQGTSRADFNIQANFKKALGDELPDQAMAPLPRRFFELAIQLKPEIAQERPSLDIPLREALRVAADWAQLEESQLMTAAGQEEITAPQPQATTATALP